MSNNQIFRNFGDVTRHLAATQPDRVALTFEGRDTTYGEFERYTNRVAAALLASGVKKGDRVAYFGKNSDRYLEIFFGAAKVGAVTTPVNWRLAGPELAYILQDSRAPILFVGEEFGDTVEQEPPRVQGVEGCTGRNGTCERCGARRRCPPTLHVRHDRAAERRHADGAQSARPPGYDAPHRRRMGAMVAR